MRIAKSQLYYLLFTDKSNENKQNETEILCKNYRNIYHLAMITTTDCFCGYSAEIKQNDGESKCKCLSYFFKYKIKNYLKQ